MNKYNLFIGDLLIKITRENKRVILKNKNSYTVIESKFSRRFAIGKGKEGKYINIPNLYNYLITKKVESYYILNDEKIKLFSDDIKLLEFIKVPTELEFEQIEQENKRRLEQENIKRSVSRWRERIENNYKKDSTYKILGYHFKKSTLWEGQQDLILDIISENEKTIMYMNSDSKEEQEQLVNLINDFIKKENKINDLICNEESAIKENTNNKEGEK